MMKPPRRPRGEKPSTTLRLLRRNLATAQQTIAALQLDRSDKEKVIAGYDVQLSEAQDEIGSMRMRGAARKIRLGESLEKLRQQSHRLAYLEGYFYAQEKTSLAAPLPVSATRSPFPGNTSQTYGRSCPGNPQDLSDGGQATTGEWRDPGAAGYGATLGDEIWRERPHYRPYSGRGSVEHVEITERPNSEWNGF